MGAVYSKQEFPTGLIGFDVICKEMSVVMCVNIVINIVMRIIMGRMQCFQGTTAAKRKRTVLYILSTINSSLGAAYGVHHYLAGSGAAENVLIDRAFHCVCVISGYILQDLLMLLPDWQTNKQDIIHHLIVLFLGFVGTHTMPIIYAILPAFALQELSTPFLNMMWYAKEYEFMANLVPQTQIKLIFALLFGIFRVIWFPLEAYAHRANILERAPSVGYGIAAFCCLQFYWFYLIVRKALGAGKKKKKAANKDAAATPTQSPSTKQLPKY